MLPADDRAITSCQCERQMVEAKTIMTVDNPKELFVLLLSNVRQGVERASSIFEELTQAVQHADIREILEARAFESNVFLDRLDQCFKLIGEEPLKVSGRLEDVLVEDFRNDLAGIRSPLARQLYTLAKAAHLTHLRIGEWIAVIAAADMTGHCGVGVLLESCLADKLAFVERTRRLIADLAEGMATPTSTSPVTRLWSSTTSR